MRKWSEIKTAILDKLFLSSEEAQQEGFLEKMQYLANEGLFRIANDAKENIKELIIETFATVAEMEACALKKAAVRGTDGVYRLDDVELYVINESFNMPSDFLSFDNEIEYEGDEYNPQIKYVGRNKLRPIHVGVYHIYYNALYPEITKTHITADNVLDIDASVLYCLPSYVGSQLLAQNDPQRSAILRNEFELMLSRLDNNVLYDNQSFKSEGGWY